MKRSPAAPYVPVHSDFVAAFSRGGVFQSPYGKITVRQHEIGILNVSSGKVIAADPSSLQWKQNQVAFARRIPAGKYPVVVSLAKCNKVERPACLLLKIKDSLPVRWELALRTGEKLSGLQEGQFYGYGVDAGMGCFVDADAALGAVNQLDWFDDVYSARILPALIKKGKKVLDWADISLDPEEANNLILCTSGNGDGVYASYWGVGRNDEVTWLVTDFGLLLAGNDVELTFDNIVQKAGSTLQHPQLGAGDLSIRVVAGQVGARKLKLQLKGKWRGSCRVALLNGTAVDYGCEKCVSDKECRLTMKPQSKLTDSTKLLVQFQAGVRALQAGPAKAKLSAKAPTVMISLDDKPAAKAKPVVNNKSSAKPALAASTRRFEFTDDKSNKFWEITVADTEVTVRFGRIGTNGQTQTKDFADEVAAQRHADKLIEEKTAKGYEEM